MYCSRPTGNSNTSNKDDQNRAAGGINDRHTTCKMTSRCVVYGTRHRRVQERIQSVDVPLLRQSGIL